MTAQLYGAHLQKLADAVCLKHSEVCYLRRTTPVRTRDAEPAEFKWEVLPIPSDLHLARALGSRNPELMSTSFQTPNHCNSGPTQFESTESLSTETMQLVLLQNTFFEEKYPGQGTGKAFGQMGTLSMSWRQCS